jgi:mono/diheme cytochrome c family protein
MRIQSTFFREVVLGTSLQILRRGITLMIVVMTMVMFYPVEAFPLFGFSEDEKKPKESAPAIPPEYKDKQMPKGWRTDPNVLAAGKAIYEGTENSDVNCAGCHGIDGKPTRKGKGAPELSNPQEAQKSDAQWFWEISEGKRRTKMRGHAKHLTEEQRWQVIAYMRTFAQ